MKVIALGGFDGLHLGHMSIVDHASAISPDAAILCFEPIPRQVLGRERHVRLTTPGERRKILSRSGSCGLLVHPFDDATMKSGPGEFLDTLQEAFRFEHIVVGYDFGFGLGRAGSPATIGSWCIGRSVDLHVVDPVCRDGEPIKSGRVRGLVSCGRLDGAEALLGRRYGALGAVARGKGLGRTLGFPTLNVRVPAAKLLPPPGSYVAEVAVDGAVHPAAVFIPSGREGLCEAHLPGWAGEAYGKAVGIEFRQFIRTPGNGLSRSELVTRIARDVERVLEVSAG